MTAGAAYGNGIYLSDNFSLSSGYGSSGKKNVVGVLELRDDASKYKKGGNVFVVDNEKVLLLRYLLIIPSSLVVKVINLINNVFINDIYKKEAKVQTTVLGKGIKKLIRELQQLSYTAKSLETRFPDIEIATQDEIKQYIRINIALKYDIEEILKEFNKFYKKYGAGDN